MTDERLGSTLFLAALVHGVVILGITFTAAPFGDGEAVSSLNVTLVVDTGREELAAETADFLANRDQLGIGEAARGLRPTSTLSAEQPTAELGDPTGTDERDATRREAAPNPEQLVSRNSGGEPVPAEFAPNEEAAPAELRAAALIQQAAPQTTALELGMRAELPDGSDDARTLIATPSTRQSGLAEYLDGWRRRVERIGTANYPRELLGDIDAGRPTLEVVIGADGRLDDIVVRKSSGDKALDQAALKILRLAAPFAPLPDEIRKEYDVLRFAYEWDFSTRTSAR